MQFRTRIEKAVKPHAVILITLFALIISMSFIAPNFLSVGNIIDIIRVNNFCIMFNSLRLDSLCITIESTSAFIWQSS